MAVQAVLSICRRCIQIKSALSLRTLLVQNKLNRNMPYLNLPSTRSFKTGIQNVLFSGGFEMQDPKSEAEVVNIVYIDKNGNKSRVRGKVGDNAMYLAHRYGIEIEGACEASLACSTCHVYVHEDFMDCLAEPDEKEEDMLDLAVFLKPNSRLGCQIILTKDMEGMELTLPQATRNFYVDGHVPQPH